ncbi:diguanylate cyclase [Pseudomonas alkylphenolica]|jgi:diguanylate cyclase (GGDEF)-like protein/PAS domain S-box-containing protein|uniref:Diguanylate cyclase n=1 Tax=Pseudomonas alkylphenolica TaxID=237609 RepID=A0A6I6GWT1_9PSED|nr:diguanylate cyclase [Pseudomonas alkylphenolica]QGW79032.1 diguanylate cyclase [Pseudomonas alkylphenolica]
MRAYLNNKNRVKLYPAVSLGIASAVAVLLGGLMMISTFDNYIHMMYNGNSAPIRHLANIRASQSDIRQLQWQVFAHRQASTTAAYARAVASRLDSIAREWQLYYPEGISSSREKQLAEQIRIALPHASTLAHESLARLQFEDYDGVMRWYEQNTPFFDRLDHLLASALRVNVEQSGQLASNSKQLFARICWAALGLSLALIALGAFALQWRRQRDDAQRKSLEHLWLVDQVFNITLNGVIITDQSGRITKVNPAFTRMTGYTQAEVLGQKPSLWSSGRQSTAFYADMWQSLIEHGQWQGQLWNRKKCGDLYLESLCITAIRSLDESTLNYVAVCSDITRQQAEQELQGYLATHDSLTDLPNRVLFRERLTQAIARGQRAGLKVAILFLDLDHFKEINDRLGHMVGDSTLTTIASRLKGCLRDVDIVARLGGDEFAMVLEDIHDVSQIEPIARKLLASVGQAIMADGHEVFVTPSIGVSVFPDDGEEPDTLVKLADKSMYEAKGAGKNAIRFHAKEQPLEML